MDPVMVTFFTVFAAVSLGFVGYRLFFSAAARARRTLRSQRSVAIRDAPEGALVKVEGLVKYVGEPMEAPLSGRSCAMWQVLVEEQGGKQKGWHKLIDDSECRPFIINDGTGIALVNAVIPKLALVQDARFQSMTFVDATERLDAFLADHSQLSTGMFGFNRNLRYREGIIEEGERVAVLGACRWEADPDGAARGGYRDAPRRLVVEDPEDGHLVISDDPSTLG